MSPSDIWNLVKAFAPIVIALLVIITTVCLWGWVAGFLAASVLIVLAIIYALNFLSDPDNYR